MRLEYDREADALYFYLKEIPYGGVARTVSVSESVAVDLDADNRVLGIEFLSLSAFERYLAEHGGLNLPEYFAGEESLLIKDFVLD